MPDGGRGTASHPLNRREALGFLEKGGAGMEEKRTKLQIGCMIAMGGVFVLFLVLYLVMSFRVECRINGEVFAAKQQGLSLIHI